MFLQSTILIGLAALFTLPGNAQSQTPDTPVADSIYVEPGLGQGRPGLEPVLFLPGVVSTEANEHGCAFMPDGSEFYFTRVIDNRPTIMVTHWNRTEGWTTPEPVSFSGEYTDRLPSVSPDGRKLYFESLRPWPDSSGEEDYRLWYVDREFMSWTEPHPLMFPTEHRPSGISVSNTGRLYLKGLTYVDPTDSGYTDPEPLNPELRGDYPYGTRDDRFILYCAHPDRSIIAVYRENDGGWSEPDIIIPQDEKHDLQGFPVMSPSGTFIFFTYDHDIYWVSANILRQP